MCDPVTLAIMVGTQMASSALNSQAEKKVNKARGNVIQNNINDQKKYRDASQVALNASENASNRSTMDQATADSAAANTAAYQAPISPGALLPGQGNTSDAVRQAIVGSLASGVDNAKATASRKAALDAFGNATFNRDIAVNRSGSDINTQQNFGQGRAGIVPLQLEHANQAGNGLKTAANWVQLLGTVAGAGYGASAAGTKAAAARATNMANYTKGLGNTLYGPLQPGAAWAAKPSWMSQFSTGY